MIPADRFADWDIATSDFVIDSPLIADLSVVVIRHHSNPPFRSPSAIGRAQRKRFGNQSQ